MNNKKNDLLPILIIGALFFIFGFITWLNSVLIPYLKIACELTNFEAYFVTFAFYISYFVMAIPSSWLMKKVGFKKGMALGLIIMAVGSLMFIPAANTRLYGLFLLGLFIQGTGLSVLQTASNPYLTIVGPIESAAKRISIMGICNKIAGAIAPLILGAIILKDANIIESSFQSISIIEKSILLDKMALKVINPYIIMATVLIVLAILIKYSPLPEINEEEDIKKDDIKNAEKTSIIQYPYLLLGVMAIFFYVGVEVVSVDSIIQYGKSLNLPPINFSLLGFNINLANPMNFATYTLIFMLAGYLLGILTIPKVLSQQRALAIMSVIGIIFSLLAVLSSGFISVIFIALLGFSNAIMWPAIWPLSIEKLGKFTKLGSALLIMAIAGGAIIPLIYGVFSDKFNPQFAYIINVPCYLFILFFALKGHLIGKK